MSGSLNLFISIIVFLIFLNAFQLFYILQLKKILKYNILKENIKLLTRENLLLEQELKKLKIEKLNKNFHSN